jgi:hypothetical protein
MYTFRRVQIKDIEFIYYLRSITSDNFLKKGDRSLNFSFLSNRIKNNELNYFCFESKTEIIGYYRFYLVNNIPEIGSWITNPQSNLFKKVLFDLEFKKKVFDDTNSDKIIFDVKIKNTSVWKHHENFGASRINENNNTYYYELNKNKFIENYERKIKRINSRSI